MPMTSCVLARRMRLGTAALPDRRREAEGRHARLRVGRGDDVDRLDVVLLRHRAVDARREGHGVAVLGDLGHVDRELALDRLGVAQRSSCTACSQACACVLRQRADGSAPRRRSRPRQHPGRTGVDSSLSPGIRREHSLALRLAFLLYKTDCRHCSKRERRRAGAAMRISPKRRLCIANTPLTS